MTSTATPHPAHFRALARQAVGVPGALRGVDAEAAWERDVQVLDLSLGGACLELSEPLPEGEAVELVIDTPKLWDPLTVPGAVRWTRAVPDAEGHRLLVGLRFEHVSGGSVRALTQLLEAEAFG